VTYTYTKSVVVISIAVYFIVFLFLSGNSEFDNSTNKVSHDVILGRKIWLKNGCVSCHSIYGLGGFLGPDLTEVSGRRDGEYIRQMILNGGDKMPAFHFHEGEINSLLSFFQYMFSSNNELQ